MGGSHYGTCKPNRGAKATSAVLAHPPVNTLTGPESKRFMSWSRQTQRQASFKRRKRTEEKKRKEKMTEGRYRKIKWPCMIRHEKAPDVVVN